MFEQEEGCSLNRWECIAGHTFEGNFFSPPTKAEQSSGRIINFVCPSCGEPMTLTREEGAIELLNHIREFVGEVSKDPHYNANGSLILTEVGRLETTIRKLAEEAARP